MHCTKATNSSDDAACRYAADDETDDSEGPTTSSSKETASGVERGSGSSAVGDLRNLDDEALHALSQKAPKNAKYNFYVDLGE